MKLTEEQKAQVTTWAAEGATLNDIQKRLKDDWDIGITYLETRFLVADLGITLRDLAAEAKAKAEAAAEAKAKAEAEQSHGQGQEKEASAEETQPADLSEEMPAGNGTVSLTLDSITIPGAIASGNATFSDGKAARWSVDQLGRLGFDADEPDYRPSEADSIAFQRELHALLSQPGGM